MNQLSETNKIVESDELIESKALSVILKEPPQNVIASEDSCDLDCNSCLQSGNQDEAACHVPAEEENDIHYRENHDAADNSGLADSTSCCIQNHTGNLVISIDEKDTEDLLISGMNKMEKDVNDTVLDQKEIQEIFITKGHINCDMPPVSNINISVNEQIMKDVNTLPKNEESTNSVILGMSHFDLPDNNIVKVEGLSKSLDANRSDMIENHQNKIHADQHDDSAEQFKPTHEPGDNKYDKIDDEHDQESEVAEEELLNLSYKQQSSVDQNSASAIQEVNTICQNMKPTGSEYDSFMTESENKMKYLNEPSNECHNEVDSTGISNVEMLDAVHPEELTIQSENHSMANYNQVHDPTSLENGALGDDVCNTVPSDILDISTTVKNSQSVADKVNLEMCNDQLHNNQLGTEGDTFTVSETDSEKTMVYSHLSDDSKEQVEPTPNSATETSTSADDNRIENDGKSNHKSLYEPEKKIMSRDKFSDSGELNSTPIIQRSDEDQILSGSEFNRETEYTEHQDNDIGITQKLGNGSEIQILDNDNKTMSGEPSGQSVENQANNSSSLGSIDGNDNIVTDQKRQESGIDDCQAIHLGMDCSNVADEQLLTSNREVADEFSRETPNPELPNGFSPEMFSPKSHNVQMDTVEEIALVKSDRNRGMIIENLDSKHDYKPKLTCTAEVIESISDNHQESTDLESNQEDHTINKNIENMSTDYDASENVSYSHEEQPMETDNVNGSASDSDIEKSNSDSQNVNKNSSYLVDDETNLQSGTGKLSQDTKTVISNTGTPTTQTVHFASPLASYHEYSDVSSESSTSTLILSPDTEEGTPQQNAGDFEAVVPRQELSSDSPNDSPCRMTKAGSLMFSPPDDGRVQFVPCTTEHYEESFKLSPHSFIVKLSVNTITLSEDVQHKPTMKDFCDISKNIHSSGLDEIKDVDVKTDVKILLEEMISEIAEKNSLTNAASCENVTGKSLSTAAEIFLPENIHDEETESCIDFLEYNKAKLDQRLYNTDDSSLPSSHDTAQQGDPCCDHDVKSLIPINDKRKTDSIHDGRTVSQNRCHSSSGYHPPVEDNTTTQMVTEAVVPTAENVPRDSEVPDDPFIAETANNQTNGGEEDTSLVISCEESNQGTGADAEHSIGEHCHDFLDTGDTADLVPAADALINFQEQHLGSCIHEIRDVSVETDVGILLEEIIHDVIRKEYIQDIKPDSSATVTNTPDNISIELDHKNNDLETCSDKYDNEEFEKKNISKPVVEHGNCCYVEITEDHVMDQTSSLKRVCLDDLEDISPAKRAKFLKYHTNISDVPSICLTEAVVPLIGSCHETLGGLPDTICEEPTVPGTDDIYHESRDDHLLYDDTYDKRQCENGDCKVPSTDMNQTSRMDRVSDSDDEKSTSSEMKVFQWKYAPSLMFDTEEKNTEDDTEVFHVPILQTCSKPVRVGLSRRQRIPHLHPNYRKKVI